MSPPGKLFTKAYSLKNTCTRPVFLITALLSFLAGGSQMITGVWKGRIDRQKVEVKIIQNGDSLMGTSYYYESDNHYRRYSIKGYFDPNTNSAVWWDDQLIDEKSGRFNLSSPGKNALLSRADYNCPGSGRMMLDGKAALKEDDIKPRGEVHLNKTVISTFADEWDYVIDNYTRGANDPDIIDSVALISERPADPSKSPPEGETNDVPNEKRQIDPPIQKIERPKEEPIPGGKVIESTKPPTIEEKFSSRKKVFTKEIPVSGDSIELRFYDNAEIDGDSISLFLNDQLIFQHIRLLGSAYIIKLAVSDLKETNELIMVAENLGAIPPNTSYMVAIVEDKHYDARLESTEGSSAMIKFVKKAVRQ